MRWPSLLALILVLWGTARAAEWTEAVATVLAVQTEATYLYRATVPPGVGSAALVDGDGLVLAPAPLVRQATWVEVVFRDGRQRRARLVGLDSLTELALLRVDPPDGVSPLPLARQGLSPGDRVWLLGRPRGAALLRPGTVLECDRLVSHRGVALAGFCLSDLDLRGAGQGPVVNERGELVAFALDLPSFRLPGGQLLLPLHLLRRALEGLRSEGQVAWPWMGVKLLPLTPSLARALRLPVEQGVLVVDTYPGSPAARAGLRGHRKEISVGNLLYPVGGDVIVSVDSQFVPSPAAFDRLIFSRQPGDVVDVLYYRGRRPHHVKIRLGRRSFVQP